MGPLLDWLGSHTARVPCACSHSLLGSRILPPTSRCLPHSISPANLPLPPPRQGLELAVPGTYIAGEPLVTIAAFAPQVRCGRLAF